MAIRSVLLKTPLTANSGYGNDGFALARGFHQQGLDVCLLPSRVIPPIPMQVAMLLVKSPDLEFDYVLQHIDPEQIGLTTGEKKMPGKKIAWSMWEFTRLSPEIAETMTKRLEGFDALYVYDEVSAEAFEPHAAEAGIPMKILQGGYWSEEWVPQPSDLMRDWNGPFRFVQAGQLHARKNPFATINAFRRVQAIHPDTQLHMKTNVRFLHPAMEQAYPGLKIFYELWSPQRMREFYTSAHCYVAPSWGEGKNLPALESATTGIPTIYSDFGGHRQWGSSEWGYPIGGTMGEHVEGIPSFRIDEDSLFESMLHAVENREEVKRKGELAQRMIPAQCDWARVLQRFVDLTSTI